MEREVHGISRLGLVTAAIMGIWLIMAGTSYAHCDTLDGPVIAAAKTALDKNDITPTLKWVRKEDEKELYEAFSKTVAVRKKGAEAKELADMYFFETLVRIHRAAEGAPYTGLKPAGEVEPGVTAADLALSTGSVDGLIKLVTEATEKGIRERYARTIRTKRDADDSVEAGRAFVAAYVDFTHYIERLHATAEKRVSHGKAAEPGTDHQH